MYERFISGDAAYDGRFFTGVRTTGIYCLPSCKARKPKRQNVRFFPTAEAARSAGFRACRKCHPDDYARGADPVLEAIEALAGEVRDDPSRFSGVSSLVRRSGFGSTRLFELFRRHYHATPADFLLRARLQAAEGLLATKGTGSIADVAARVGFESLSVLHEHFREHTGLTPAAYRELGSARRFEIALPAGYPLSLLRRHLSRDPHSIHDRLDGDRYTAAIRFGPHPVLLRLALAPDAVEVTWDGADPDLSRKIHATVCGLLGLGQDPAAFVRLVRRLGFGRLVEGRTGLRVFQTLSPFDGIIWSIAGQQVNLSFAGLLRRRLAERAGTPVAEGLIAPPTAESVARLEPADLLPLQFSRRKAEYLVTLARRIAEGAVPLDRMASFSATRAERILLAERGLGPWAVNYLMMRAFAFADCVPHGDTGLTGGLRILLRLEERPGIDATRRLVSVFAPYRSLATFHLWQLNASSPP